MESLAGRSLLLQQTNDTLLFTSLRVLIYNSKIPDLKIPNSLRIQNLESEI